MQQTIALLAAGTLSLAAHAQPVLTAATNTPVPGTSYTLNHGAYLNPGMPGMGQTWNLSGLVADSSVYVEYTTVAATPNGV